VAQVEEFCSDDDSFSSSQMTGSLSNWFPIPCARGADISVLVFDTEISLITSYRVSKFYN
jgi:hypothetical protein